jgi:maltose-binding protein MalE
MVVGGDCGDDKENISVNNPQVISCLETYKALNQFFYIESDSVTYESVIEDFLAGKVVFTIVTSDAVAVLEQAAEEERFPYSYGMCLMPDPSGELQGRSLSVTNAIAINGYSAYKDLANQFAAFLVTEYASELYGRAGKLATNKNVNTEHELLQVFQQEYAESIPLNKMIETSNFWIQLEILFSQVWNGEDVATLVSELEQQLETQIIRE